MSEEQKAKYDRAAVDYSPFGSLEPIGSGSRELFETRKRHFIAGTEHAHPIGFNLGKEEGKKEGRIEAIDQVIKYINEGWGITMEELQNLRK